MDACSTRDFPAGGDGEETMMEEEEAVVSADADDREAIVHDVQYSGGKDYDITVPAPAGVSAGSGRPMAAISKAALAYWGIGSCTCHSPSLRVDAGGASQGSICGETEDSTFNHCPSRAALGARWWHAAQRRRPRRAVQTGAVQTGAVHETRRAATAAPPTPLLRLGRAGSQHTAVTGRLATVGCG